MERTPERASCRCARRAENSMERRLFTADFLKPDIAPVGAIPLGTFEASTMVAVGEFGAHKDAPAASEGDFHLGSFYAPIPHSRDFSGFPKRNILPGEPLCG